MSQIDYWWPVILILTRVAEMKITGEISQNYWLLRITGGITGETEITGWITGEI